MSHINNRKTLFKFTLGATFFIALTGVTLNGQDADDEKDVFEFSPFVVTTDSDRGYLSTNATSGTSLNTAIRDIPMPLEVINQEFIEDLQANDLKESLAYSAGVYTTSGGSINVSGFRDASPSGASFSAFTNTISLRGYTVPNSQRLGFRVGALVPKFGIVLGGSTDTITAERSEVVRGPNSLLYGINVLSGVVNIVPKEPLGKNRQWFGVTYGSNDYRRGTIDLTGPIIDDKLNYRFMYAGTLQNAESDFRSEERNDYALQFKWMITPKYELFVEGRYSDFIRQGIGSSWLTDDGGSGDAGWIYENPYGNNIRIGRDDYNLPQVSFEGEEFGTPFIPRPDREYLPSNYDVGRHYRITGPDTYFDRKEKTFTALLRANFTKDLKGEFGLYKVEQEEETFNVDFRVFTDTRGPIQPAPIALKRGKPNASTLWWFQNPEVASLGSLDELEDDPIYAATYGLGETFVFPFFTSGNAYPVTFPQAHAGDPTNDEHISRKFARYIWYKDPTTADSMQLRGRLVYTLETEFLTPATHVFGGGVNYIKDEVSFVTANVTRGNDQYMYSGFRADVENGREADDPVYFRNSVYDLTPLRYNGENLALLINPSTDRLDAGPEGIRWGQNDGDFYLGRSGHQNVELWYRGAYAFYQGTFLNERLNLLGGLRHDQYQVLERENLVVIDHDRESDQWQGTISPVTPWFVGYGDGEYVRPDGLPDGLNTKVETSYDRLREYQPEGTNFYNFDDYQKFTTGTVGMNFRIIDPVSLYMLYAEGVFPNTGQKDGNYDPIGAETTTSKEIGFKFDLMDGKLSGTISFYKIKRENAVFYWADAPAPSRWTGGLDGPSLNDSNKSNTQYFSPQAALAAGTGYQNNAYHPPSYAVALDYVAAAYADLGREAEFSEDIHWVETDEQGNPIKEWTIKELFEDNQFWPLDQYIVSGAGDPSEVDYRETTGAIIDDIRIFQNKVFIRADHLNSPEAALIRRAFELALVSEDPLGFPIHWNSSSGANPYNNNPSNQRALGANVLYSEEGTGFDGQIIYSPTDNYQILFTFSNQKREVVGSGFQMVDAFYEDPETGETVNFGTQWDKWVYILGVENFEDPSLPSTFNGNGVNGLDLSLLPSTSLRMWNKYRFSEGPLDGLEIGGGVRYQSATPTSVSIGGKHLAENRFLTPDRPSTVFFDGMLSYKFKAWGANWRASLRVSNLFNKTRDIIDVHYPDNGFGGSELRRTEVYYGGRSFRFTLGASF
jgi:outer membrane receptor protein involved in Fe transport